MNKKAMSAGSQGFSQLILVVIAGVVIVAAGGIFWYYQQPSGQNKSVPDSLTTPELSFAPSKAAEQNTVSETPALTGALAPTEQVPTPTGTALPAPSKAADQNIVSKTPTPTNAPTPVPTKQIPTPTVAVLPSASPVPNISCTNPTDTRQMDVFDSHVHTNSKVSMSQIISEMDKAGASVANLYSGTLDIASQYPGRFITFVDTPSDWLEQGQTFVTLAETQLKTGKFYGIGETNLRYYSGKLIPPPTVYTPADTPAWLQLVDLSAQYHVPISFHFVPDDATANIAFEKMLSHNKNAILIWAHLGFNNMTLSSVALNDYLLRYPHLYFDTAGIQNMQQNPAPQSNSNWWMLTSQANNGQLNKEWRQFFETWNSRFLFGSDAGGGGNGMERWLNYASDAVDGATPDAVGHWRNLLSNLDSNSARNILSSNSRTLFLKMQKAAYSYSVASNGKCYTVSVSSSSSVSALTFNSSTRVIAFTVADSNGTAGNAVITIPISLAGGNFTASVDGQSVESQLTSNSANTIISLEYTGGIRSVTLSASNTP